MVVINILKKQRCKDIVPILSEQVISTCIYFHRVTE
jgi:hypothetical protein